MARTNRQDQFLRKVHDAVNLWENSKSRERQKLLGLAFSILLILDGKHRDDDDNKIKYTLLDPEGMVISGDLHENFDDADPYREMREYMKSL